MELNHHSEVMTFARIFNRYVVIAGVTCHLISFYTIHIITFFGFTLQSYNFFQAPRRVRTYISERNNHRCTDQLVRVCTLSYPFCIAYLTSIFGLADSSKWLPYSHKSYFVTTYSTFYINLIF